MDLVCMLIDLTFDETLLNDIAIRAVQTRNTRVVQFLADKFHLPKDVTYTGLISNIRKNTDIFMKWPALSYHSYLDVENGEPELIDADNPTDFLTKIADVPGDIKFWIVTPKVYILIDHDNGNHVLYETQHDARKSVLIKNLQKKSEKNRRGWIRTYEDGEDEQFTRDIIQPLQDKNPNPEYVADLILQKGYYAEFTFQYDHIIEVPFNISQCRGQEIYMIMQDDFIYGLYTDRLQAKRILVEKIRDYEIQQHIKMLEREPDSEENPGWVQLFYNVWEKSEIADSVDITEDDIFDDVDRKPEILDKFPQTEEFYDIIIRNWDSFYCNKIITNSNFDLSEEDIPVVIRPDDPAITTALRFYRDYKSGSYRKMVSWVESNYPLIFTILTGEVPIDEDLPEDVKFLLELMLCYQDDIDVVRWNAEHIDYSSETLNIIRRLHMEEPIDVPIKYHHLLKLFEGNRHSDLDYLRIPRKINLRGLPPIPRRL